MKNSIRISIMVILIFLIFVFINKGVNAIENVSVKLSSDEEVKLGEQFKVFVTINGNSNGIKGIQGKITYDKNAVEYVENNSEKKGWSITGFNKDTGIFLAEVLDVNDSSSYISNKTTVLSFTFKLKNTFKKGETTINVSNLIGAGETSIIMKDTSRKIKVKEYKVETSASEETAGTNKESSKENNSASSGQAMPYTGISDYIYGIVGIMLILTVIFYIGYRKYDLI